MVSIQCTPADMPCGTVTVAREPCTVSTGTWPLIFAAVPYGLCVALYGTPPADALSKDCAVVVQLLAAAAAVDVPATNTTNTTTTGSVGRMRCIARAMLAIVLVPRRIRACCRRWRPAMQYVYAGVACFLRQRSYAGLSQQAQQSTMLCCPLSLSLCMRLGEVPSHDRSRSAFASSYSASTKLDSAVRRLVPTDLLLLMAARLPLPIQYSPRQNAIGVSI